MSVLIFRSESQQKANKTVHKVLHFTYFAELKMLQLLQNHVMTLL